MFGKDASTKDKLRCWCRECWNASARKRHAADPEKRNARDRRAYAANPEKILVCQRDRRAANRAKNKNINPYRDPLKLKRCGDCEETKVVTDFHCNASNNGGLQNICKDCANARVSAHQRAHPEQYNAKEAKRRAKAAAPLTPERSKQVTEVYRIAELASAFMQSPFDVDHIRPVSRGGKTVPGNLRPLPKALNAAKGTKTHADALQTVPGYREWCEGPPTYEKVTYITLHGHKRSKLPTTPHVPSAKRPTRQRG
ncbi:MAG: HNH endonuclease signature motif containing protein [Steroidobacteraceae bacterium]